MQALATVAVFAFPFLLFLVADQVPAYVLLLIFVCIMALRLALLPRLTNRAFIFALGALLAFALITLSGPTLTWLKLYPVLISATGFFIIAYTLAFPPTAMERLVKLTGEPITPMRRKYLVYLSCVWLTFFVVNGCIAAWTAFSQSTAVWTLYNGVISYVLVGTLLGGEYLVRIWFRRRFETDGPQGA